MTTLVVSDLHLDAAHAASAARFRDFLAGPARAAGTLYVLGDLFEAWIGDDDPCPFRAEVTRWLRALAESGVAVAFMHGNRDFLLGERFCHAAGGTLLADPTIVHAHGRRALLTHGDALCTGDAPYQKLRALVRDRDFQARFLALGRSQREALAAEARAGSREHTAGQQAMLMDVDPRAVLAAFRAADVDCIVHGHTHRPGIHEVEVDGRHCTRAVTGDWYETGSVLRWDASGFELLCV